jgi:hypothetical protein
MNFILRLAVLWGVAALSACGTIGPSYSPMAQTPAAQPAPAQTAALEPEPTQVAPRRTRRTAPPSAQAAAEATASITSQETQPVVVNSPEWKEREKRREEELSRKINSICRGC